MNFRLTVALLAILVILGGVVLFSERGSEAPATPTAVAGERIFSFETKNLSGLAISWTDKQVDLRRDINGQWQIAQPEQAPADSAALEGFADRLGQLRSTRDIVAQSGELPSYGLDKPQATITVTLRTGETQRLLVGGASPDGSTYYTRKPGSDQQVLVRVAPAPAAEALKQIAQQPPKAPAPTVTPGGPALATPVPSPSPQPSPAGAPAPVPTPLLRPAPS